jgi:hypothetical protein
MFVAFVNVGGFEKMSVVLKNVCGFEKNSGQSSRKPPARLDCFPGKSGSLTALFPAESLQEASSVSRANIAGCPGDG